MRTEKINEMLQEGLRNKYFPCAAFAIGDKDGLLYKDYYGVTRCFDDDAPCFDAVPEKFTGITPPLNEKTLFDMASCSKIMATTMLALKFLEEGKITLYDSISRFFEIPEDKKDIEIRHLLTHTSGIRQHFLLENDGRAPEQAVEIILSQELAYPTGTKVAYSCMGFILLGKILEKVGGAPIDVLADEVVFKPLGMKNTCYNPLQKGYTNIAATEFVESVGGYKQGLVHDENALFLRGVSANAGVFSTLDDVVLFAKMLANKGKIDGGEAFLAPSTFNAAIYDYTRGMEEGRGLGFVVREVNTLSAMGDLFPDGSYGHNGFTGTSIYVHGETGLFIVLLTNRVHFTRASQGLYRFRRMLFNLCVSEYEKTHLPFKKES